MQFLYYAILEIISSCPFPLQL